MRGGILDGVERRRRRSDDEKLAILMEVGLRGSTVTRLAQRHEVTRQQIYAWRHDLKRKGVPQIEADPVLLALEPPPNAEPPLPTPAELEMTTVVSSTLIEIALRNGRLLRVPADMEDVVLQRLIRAVEAA